MICAIVARARARAHARSRTARATHRRRRQAWPRTGRTRRETGGTERASRRLFVRPAVSDRFSVRFSAVAATTAAAAAVLLSSPQNGLSGEGGRKTPCGLRRVNHSRTCQCVFMQTREYCKIQKKKKRTRPGSFSCKNFYLQRFFAQTSPVTLHYMWRCNTFGPYTRPAGTAGWFLFFFNLISEFCPGCHKTADKRSENRGDVIDQRVSGQNQQQ